MSQLDTTNIQARTIARRNTMPIPAIGITESLNAPGVVPIGPNDRSARIAQQFDAALAATASIVNTLAVDDRRQQIEQERSDAEAKQIDYGHGTYAARLKAPTVVQDILDGKVQPPPGVAMDDWVQSVVDQNASDMSPAFREAYAKQIGPAMVDAWTKRSDGVNEQARVTVNTSILSGAATDSPIQPYIDEYKKNNPQVNDVQARTAVGFAKAEYAASTRNGDMLESAITEAGLEGIDKLKVASLRARYKNEQSRWESEQSDAAENVYVDRINSGEPSAAIREAVQNDKALTPRSKLNLKRMLDGQIEKDISDAQQASFNTLARDIELGRWMTDPAGSPSVETTLSDIERRAFLDPKDPDFISHGQMKYALDTIRSTIKFDAGVETVNAAISDIAQGNTSRFVATQADDKAVVSVLASRGIVDATPNGEKSPIVNTVANPIAFGQIVSEFGRVPEQVADKIRAQMASGDEQQALDGYTAYGALYLQNPVLARTIVKGDQALELKAAFVASALDRGGTGLLTDGDRLRGEVRSRLPQSLKLDPKMLEYDRDQILGIVYHKNAMASTTMGGQRQLLDSAVVGAQKDVQEWLRGPGSLEGNFARAWARDANMDNIPSNVTETYLKNLDQQYRVYRSFVADEDSAVAMAKKAAVEQTMTDHPPQEWNGRVYFMRKGTPTVPQSVIRDELMVMPKDADPLGYPIMANERLDDLENNHIPEWDGTGWTFVSKTQINYDGSPQYYLSQNDREIGKLRVVPPTENDQQRRLIEKIDATRLRMMQEKGQRRNDVYSLMGQGFTP